MNVARRLLVVGAFGAVLIGGWRFASQNSESVTVTLWLLGARELTLWQALALSFAGGATLVGLLAGYALARANLVTRRYRSAVSGLESEVHQLRNLPLAGAEAAHSDENLPTLPGEGGGS